MKVNKQLKKYQPIIQTIGIIVLIIALVVSIWQNWILKKELDLTYENKKKELLPRFSVKIEQEKSNLLFDKFVFSSYSEHNYLQKEEIILVNNSTPIVLETHNGEVKSNRLKNELVLILNKYYRMDSEYGIIYSMNKMSYPIAIKYTYESYGIIKDTVILYEYHFTTYYNNEKSKIKSEGLEFVKYLSNDMSEITKSLIKYNINNSFLSNFPNSIYDIKEEIILKDALMSRILNFVISNLTFTEHRIIIADSTYRTVYYYLPYYFSNDSALKKRFELIDDITTNIDSYDADIASAFRQVLEKEKIFLKLTSSTHLDSIPYNSKTQLYKEEYNDWYKVNADLKSLLLNKVKI